MDYRVQPILSPLISKDKQIANLGRRILGKYNNFNITYLSAKK